MWSEQKLLVKPKCTEACVCLRSGFSQFEAFMCSSNRFYISLTSIYNPCFEHKKHPSKPYKPNIVSNVCDDVVIWSIRGQC
jgi:hypothetical protein